MLQGGAQDCNELKSQSGHFYYVTFDKKENQRNKKRQENNHFKHCKSTKTFRKKKFKYLARTAQSILYAG